MDYPVMHEERLVGSCRIERQGLYWLVDCTCEILSDRVERLYCGQRRLGVLEREEDRLVCRRRISVSSAPELPPKTGVLTLSPVQEKERWEGKVLGKMLSGFREGNMLLFPYDAEQPCPCEPLLCFFEIRGGFWRLPIRDEWINEIPG